jgi:acyl carrier protein
MVDSRAQVLLDFVRRNLDSEADVDVTLDTPLLSDGLIDSMGLTLLAAFVEEEFHVPFDGTELRAGGPETIRALLDLIARRS